MASEIRVTVPFSQIPEWVLDHEQSGLSDRAVRLYGILQRYGNGPDAVCVPGRASLARRLGCSEDSIDRAKAELVKAGALIEHRRGARLTNQYVLETGGNPQVRSGAESGSGPRVRTRAVHESAPVRNDREELTDKALEPKNGSRAPDIVWDTLVEIMGMTPNTMERGRWNAAVKSLKESQATPETIREAARVYRTHPTYKDCALTVTALAANWTVLTGNGKTAKDLAADDLRRRIAEQERT